MSDSPNPVFSDERTDVVKVTGEAIMGRVLGYGILLDVMYHSYKFNEARWELMGLLVIAGLIGIIYQKKQKTLNRHEYKKMGLVCGIAVLTSIILVLVLKSLRHWH
jgi:hypothetical protein